MVTAGQAVDSKPIEGSVIAQQANTDFATDQILQGKLSHWLDVVELHLNVVISLRSASFFSALSNLKELDSQSVEAVKQISEIKGILDAVNTKIARKGLYVVRQGIRRRRLNCLVWDGIGSRRFCELLIKLKSSETRARPKGPLSRPMRQNGSGRRACRVQAANATQASCQTREETAMAITSKDNEDQDGMFDKGTQIPATTMTALRRHGEHHPPVRIAHIKCMALVPT